MGLYLHIPFCARKCNYCDFLSFGGVPEEEQTAYFNALINEIKYNAEIYNNKYYVDTIFIGGGTPSLVGEALISEVMKEVRNNFDVVQNAEISIESNPKTLTEAKLNAYLESGINRLSIGAQSFDGGLLNCMGRIHNAEDFLKNYSAARECGFKNINIDLMFAIPGQTMKIWTDTLDRAIGLEPEHISFYSLQLEEGTPFFSMFEEGSLNQIDDELDRTMYHTAIGMLKNAGYYHYEISNAARERFECRHNLKYWSMDDYLGLGLGAHSYMDGVRFSNLTDLSRYNKIDEPYCRNKNLSEAFSPYIQWRHENTKEENLSEYLFTGMRKLDGVDLVDFEKRFGQPVEMIFSDNWPKLQKHMEDGFIIKTDHNMRFTIKGIDISNRILTEFI